MARCSVHSDLTASSLSNPFSISLTLIIDNFDAHYPLEALQLRVPGSKYNSFFYQISLELDILNDCNTLQYRINIHSISHWPLSNLVSRMMFLGSIKLPFHRNCSLSPLRHINPTQYSVFLSITKIHHPVFPSLLVQHEISPFFPDVAKFTIPFGLSHP